MYDIRFKSPSTFILAGASQCGKTSMTLNILRHGDILFEDGRCVQNVVYFYKEWQKSFNGAKNEGLVQQWVNELPSCESIRDRVTLFKDRGGSIVVIDDFASQLNKDIIVIFSVLSHHLNVTVLLLTQNLFSKNPVFREISLNSTYIILFKNPRDASQITSYAKQFSPGKINYIIDSFREATKRPYSYLLFDHHQSTPDTIRVRSRFLPHELPTIVWLPKQDKQ